VPRARKLAKVTYEEMLELASVGAKVLQTRSVGLAMKERVRVQVLSSLTGPDAPMADTLPGTMIVGEEENDDVERQLITGIAHDKNEAKITLTTVPDTPGSVAAIFEPLAAANINVDMIIQNMSQSGMTDISFTIPRADIQKALPLIQDVAKGINAKSVAVTEAIAKVSLVGVGMRSDSGVAAKMFTVLSQEGVNILMISTSEIKISCVIDEKYVELAMRALHTAFGLDQLPSGDQSAK